MYVCMYGAAVLMEKKNASMHMAMYVRIKLVLWVNSDFRGCIISTYVCMHVWGGCANGKEKPLCVWPCM